MDPSVEIETYNARPFHWDNIKKEYVKPTLESPRELKEMRKGDKIKLGDEMEEIIHVVGSPVDRVETTLGSGFHVADRTLYRWNDRLGCWVYND